MAGWCSVLGGMGGNGLLIDTNQCYRQEGSGDRLGPLLEGNSKWNQKLT
jgi:hypothetical protein